MLIEIRSIVTPELILGFNRIWNKFRPHIFSLLPYKKVNSKYKLLFSCASLLYGYLSDPTEINLY